MVLDVDRSLQTDRLAIDDGGIVILGAGALVNFSMLPAACFLA